MPDYRISVYLFDSERPNAIDDLEIIADELMKKYRGNIFNNDGHIRFLITAADIELPGTVEEFSAAVEDESFAILAPSTMN